MRLPASLFRDEAFYKVRLNISNTDLTFLQILEINFVPKSCQYYIISNANAYSTYLNVTDP